MQPFQQVSQISALPRSTVSSVIVKWKRLGAHKLTECDRRVLNHTARKIFVCPRLQHSLPSSKLPVKAMSAQ
jgi:hypothetical protein